MRTPTFKIFEKVNPSGFAQQQKKYEESINTILHKQETARLFDLAMVTQIESNAAFSKLILPCPRQRSSLSPQHN